MITDDFMYGLLAGIVLMLCIHIYACLTREQALYRIGIAGGMEKIGGEWFKIQWFPMYQGDADAHSHPSQDEIA